MNIVPQVRFFTSNHAATVALIIDDFCGSIISNAFVFTVTFSIMRKILESAPFFGPPVAIEFSALGSVLI